MGKRLSPKPAAGQSATVALKGSHSSERAVAVLEGGEWAAQTRALELAQTEQLWRSIFDFAPMPMMVVDADHRIVAFNRALETLTGWSAERAIGRPCWTVCGCSDPWCAGPREGADCPMAGRHGKSSRRGRVVAVSGNKIDILIRRSQLPHRDGEPAYQLVVIEEGGKSGSAAAVQPDIVASASHELLSPLNLIGGYTTTLLEFDGVLSPEQRRRYLKGMQSATARAVGLVRNFLDVYRLESNGIGLCTEPTDLIRLLESVVAEVQAQTANHKIRLANPDKPPKVVLDPQKMERVVSNLLVNAVKYSPEGGEIEVSAVVVASKEGTERLSNRRGSTELPYLLVSFRDSGVGIPEGDLKKVFGRFYRVESKLTHATPGVGLGLYICRMIVEAHGGRIWVDSVFGQGSTFNFTLPLRKA